MTDDNSYSFLTPYGYQASSCGYCKDEDSGGSYYARSSRMTVDHYQALIDRCWRRSGDTLYHPDPSRSCCPHYTIRLPARDFKPRRDQRQAINRWNKFVLGESYIKETSKLAPKSRSEKNQSRNEFNLVTAIHESEKSYQPTVTSTKSAAPEPAHSFTVDLEENNFSTEKFNLFQAYQRHVHDDPFTPSRFKSFLCSSPLVRTSRPLRSSGAAKPLGSFHQCYRLDGKLIAMAVLDLLPHAVSGVYFIYDPEYESYGLGKISALRETAFALEEGYEYYYMGFYIHSCSKMKYKNDFKPQSVLDYETCTWFPLDDEAVQEKLSKKGWYIPLSADIDEDDSLKNGSSRMRTDPAAFARSGSSTLATRTPGIMSVEQVKQLDLGDLIVKLKEGYAPMSALNVWDEDGDLTASRTFKAAIAELVATVGPEVKMGMVLEL